MALRAAGGDLMMGRITKIEELLEERFRYVSRRSFLSRMTRLVFAVAGVGIVERVRVSRRSLASATTPDWQNCMTSGRDCDCVGAGNATAWGQWIGCCFNPNATTASECWAR